MLNPFDAWRMSINHIPEVPAIVCVSSRQWSISTIEPNHSNCLIWLVDWMVNLVLTYLTPNLIQISKVVDEALNIFNGYDNRVLQIYQTCIAGYMMLWGFHRRLKPLRAQPIPLWFLLFSFLFFKLRWSFSKRDKWWSLGNMSAFTFARVLILADTNM